MILIHIIFAGANLGEKDAHHKYHDYAGTLGHSIIVVKLLIAGIYYHLRSKNEKNVQPK